MELSQQILEQSRLININKEVNGLLGIAAQSAHWSKRSIYRIPACIVDLNEKAYKPQIVSIGPYHHGMERLKGMEEHKHRALVHFLRRSNVRIETLINDLIPLVENIKEAYDQLDTEWHINTGKFLDMMILDGCFILEVLRICEGARPSSNVQDYASNDPIFSRHGNLHIVSYLSRDMLMLENQIPILVLEILASVESNPSLKKDEELTKLILKFFSPTISTKHLPQFNKSLHILDVCCTTLLLEEPPRKPHLKGQAEQDHIGLGRDEIIWSATELIEAGIQIEKSRTRSLKDISFRKGVLKLPLVVVDDALESLYLNLIAFEKFHVGASNEVTSYIFFMDNIIDNARDVSLLDACGIIYNILGSNETVANLFNSLSKDVTLDPNRSLDEVHKKVNPYCQEPWHLWRANLVRTYFTSPLANVSIVPAIILFAATILQAVYGVLSYNKQ